MKKAKVMLAGIVVFTIIGGAYAHSAQRVGQFVWFRMDAAVNNCNVKMFNRTFVPSTSGQMSIYRGSVTLVQGPCPDVHDVFTGM